MKYKWKLAIASVLSLFFLIPALADEPSDKPDTLNIGVVTFFSGSGAVAGGPAVKAAKMTIDEINNGGGIDGVKIKAKYVDESGGPTENVAKLRQLADDVDVVVGYISSSDCLAVAPVAEKLGIPTIFSACDTTSLFPGHDYKWIFRTQNPDVVSAVSMAMYALKTGVNMQTFAGINQDYSYGHDIWNYFVAAMHALSPDSSKGIELFPKLFSGQYGSQIARLQAAQPDFVLSQLWGGDLVAFIQQAKARLLFDRTQVGLAVGTLGGIKGFENMPEGVIVGADQGYLFHPGDIEDEKLEHFLTEYKKRNGHYPVGAFPYTLRRAIVTLKAGYERAIEQQNGAWPTPDQLVKGLEGVEVETVLGTIKMRKNHQAEMDNTVGVTVRTSKYPFAVLNHIIHFPPELVMPPEGTEDTMKWVQSLDPSILDKVPDPIVYSDS